MALRIYSGPNKVFYPTDERPPGHLYLSEKQRDKIFWWEFKNGGGSREELPAWLDFIWEQ